MAKVPVNKKKKTGKTHEGTPTMVLLPARKYHFRVLDEEYKITIPRTGEYDELAPDLFKEEDGAFDILDKESNILYMPAISKVLFATAQYPALESGQLFAPIALIFEEETVDIIGQLIEILPVNQPKK